MPLPTLLQKGSLVANDPAMQSQLDNIVAIEYIMDWFKHRMEKTGLGNRILVLKSDTGSGKTTAIPPYLWTRFAKVGRPHSTIGVTQPKVITAIANAKEVANIDAYPDMKMGQTVGFSTGSSKRKPRHGVLYMTIGTLSTQLKFWDDESIMDKYSFIILDEVHELSMEMAQTLYLLKKFMVRNAAAKKLPFLVCTSATIEPEKYLAYFDLSMDNFISVAGFAYHKEEHWAKVSSNNYIEGAIGNVREIHENNLGDAPDRSDILIFLPGAKEMSEVERGLQKYQEVLANSGKKVFDIIQVDSRAVNTHSIDYVKTFMPANKLKAKIKTKNGTKTLVPLRKVILSTSVAETGLTLDTLKYVIDSGYHRGTEYYPHIPCGGLLTKPASKSRIRQRMGRAGRKFPGEFWPVYTKETYDRLPAQQFSDLVLGDITLSMLSIMNLEGEKFRPTELDFIDEISADAVATGMEKCFHLGFYSAERQSITEFGRLAEKFNQVKAENVRMIMSAWIWGAAPVDVITIAAWLQMGMNDFVAPGDSPDWDEIYKEALPAFLRGNKEQNLFRNRILIADNFIDGLFLYHAIANIIQVKNFYSRLMKWCDKVKIQFTGIINFIKMRDDLIEQCLNIGLDVFNDKTRLIDIMDSEFINGVKRLKHCIRDGYHLQRAIWDGNTYRYGGDGTTPGPLDISIPPLFSDAELALAMRKKYGLERKMRPREIFFDDLMLKARRGSTLYEIKSMRVSSADGWI